VPRVNIAAPVVLAYLFVDDRACSGFHKTHIVSAVSFKRVDSGERVLHSCTMMCNQPHDDSQHECSATGMEFMCNARQQ
jgi:hypothetical protein